MKKPPRAMNLTGMKFNKWTVLQRAENNSNRSAVWWCECECGTIRKVTAASLRSNKSKSCGKCRPKNYKLKQECWNGIMQRCYNPSYHHYKDYGGRGIEVEKEWHDFEKFKKDTGKRPRGATLDRPKNDENYGPNNWRWATPLQQANNRRDNVYLTLNDETHTFSEWSRKLNIDVHTLYCRKKRTNWSDEKILTTPVRKWRKK